ncbi:MAG: GIY-YIG nuclease family protein [Stellaceae bacterium]
MMTNRRNGTLYSGVTDTLARRAWEHRTGQSEGFTKKYGLKMLVYLEKYDDMLAARQRERNIKHWPRGLEGAPNPRSKSRLGGSLRSAGLRRGWPGRTRTRTKPEMATLQKACCASWHCEPLGMAPFAAVSIGQVTTTAVLTMSSMR